MVPIPNCRGADHAELREKYKASGVVKKEKDPTVLDKASLPKYAHAKCSYSSG